MSTRVAHLQQNNEGQQELNAKRSTYVPLFAGGLAGTLGAVLTCPLEVIKTRYQSSQSHFFQENHRQNSGQTFHSRPTIIGSLRYILKYEGFRGLFKGLTPNLIGVAPARAVYFFAYANTKSFLTEKLKGETPLVHCTSAAVAGIVMSTCTNPLWFIKTRLQIDRRNIRAMELVRNVYRDHGILGFYKGISASYIGVSETIVHFVIYEYVKAQLQSINGSDETSFSSFCSYLCAAACSKSCAATLCYPHEVVRTRLREEGNKYRTFFQTLKTVYYEESFAGLYRGLLTHLIRQIPNTAIMMSTYELIVAFLLPKTIPIDDQTQVLDETDD